MEPHTLLMFAAATLSLNLIPGPDVAYVVSSAMRGRLRAGIRAALGLGLGYLVHTAAAVLGLSALILSSAFLFALVKYLGALYLLYLGLMALRNCWRGGSPLTLTQAPVRGLFRQGVVVSVLNPKVAIFFLSFLPQFVSVSSANPAGELMLLGLLFSLLATLSNSLYACLGGLVFGNPAGARYTRLLEGGSGLLLLGLGARIALSRH
ncbi:LysE family translocator [Zobellella taiwanensis]|uniref:LysE family translocator n=1 Tax=Zobellella taiwanensis TaxID=347535 RepID=A0A2P7QT29_9GAMM|nr:LysE family translocator [Zobellella taiwanensis]PSJ41116.1 LysE family translocator [Zobellella taiwanensis]